MKRVEGWVQAAVLALLQLYDCDCRCFAFIVWVGQRLDVAEVNNGGGRLLVRSVATSGLLGCSAMMHATNCMPE